MNQTSTFGLYKTTDCDPFGLIRIKGFSWEGRSKKVFLNKVQKVVSVTTDWSCMGSIFFLSFKGLTCI